MPRRHADRTEGLVVRRQWPVLVVWVGAKRSACIPRWSLPLRVRIRNACVGSRSRTGVQQEGGERRQCRSGCRFCGDLYLVNGAYGSYLDNIEDEGQQRPCAQLPSMAGDRWPHTGRSSPFVGTGAIKRIPCRLHLLRGSLPCVRDCRPKDTVRNAHPLRPSCIRRSCLSRGDAQGRPAGGKFPSGLDSRRKSRRSGTWGLSP